MSGEPKTHTPEQFQHRYPVEAIQFTGENASQVYKFINYRVKTVSGDDVRSANERGVMRYLTVVPDIHKGDWLVRRPKPLHKRDGYEVNRELVVYSDEDFHATFEPVGVRVVARDEDDFWKGAEVLPLKGKYYGTGVAIGHATIRVWDHSYYGAPSRRQLDDYGHEGKEWDDLTPEEKFDITCDSHYETQADYDLALKIAALPDLISALDDLIDEANSFYKYSHGKIVESVRVYLGESIERARKAMAKAYGEDEWL